MLCPLHYEMKVSFRVAQSAQILVLILWVEMGVTKKVLATNSATVVKSAKFGLN